MWVAGKLCNLLCVCVIPEQLNLTDNKALYRCPVRTLLNCGQVESDLIFINAQKKSNPSQELILKYFDLLSSMTKFIIQNNHPIMALNLGLPR